MGRMPMPHLVAGGLGGGGVFFEGVEEEGEHVGPFLHGLVFGGADAVAALEVDAEEDGVFRGGGGLEVGGHFAGLPGVDAGVVDAGGDEGGGVGGVGADVLGAIHGVEVFEAFLSL